MADGPGYNPYRKANGEFASKDELGDLNEKLASDLVDAQDSGNEELADQIESYAMEKHPESPLGKKLLEERYGAAATTRKAESKYAKLGVRELQKEAKDTTDRELQLEIAKRGNGAALKNLARNPEATPEAIEAAYIRTDDNSVRQELATNLNSDLRIMHPSHVAYAAVESLRRSEDRKDRTAASVYVSRALAIARDDDMDDATVSELRNLRQEELDGNRRLPKTEGKLVDEAMANPNNRISESVALDYAKSSPRSATIALEANRISPEHVGELDYASARFDRSSDTAVLKRAAKLSAEGHWDQPKEDPWGNSDPYGREGREIAKRIIDNEATPQSALHSFVGNDRADQIALYNNPRLAPSSRRELEERSPEVQSHLRILEARGGRSVEDLRAELKVADSSVHTERGYHQVQVQLDTEKVRSYGLTRSDVERVMGGDGKVFRYDPDSGNYGGAFDSSD